MDVGRILLADDEETFLLATADVLRREGYVCDCAPDARVAAEMLQRAGYELLIADIKMPGNPELELIKELRRLAPGLPVILVTGYPSIGSATESIRLPVVAYLVKPIDVSALLGHVRTAIENYRKFRRVCESRRRVDQLCRELSGLEELMQRPDEQTGAVSTAEFLDLSVQNIINSIQDVRHLSLAMSGEALADRPCHLLACPQMEALSAALEETIQVLRETKGSFKSKALGELRRKLEVLMVDARRPVAEREPVSPGP